PLLAKHCLECHSTSSSEGGLDLSLREAAMAGGESGIAIEPGDAAESLLWTMVASGEMPKDRPAMSTDELQLLRKWIDGGARWDIERIDPLANSSDRRAGYDWWSLQPIKQAELPTVSDRNWPTNAIDHF